MLLSDKQRHSSIREIGNFKRDLTEIESAELEEEWHREVQIAAIQSEIENLQQEIAEYDLLKSGGITFAKSFAMERLPDVLVRARIASGMTQTDLATRLDLKPQQIQRYEASNYQGASLSRLIEISNVLGVCVEGFFRNQRHEGGGLLVWSRETEIDWQRLPIKEMVEGEWFSVPNEERRLDATRRFFENACDDPTLSAALHRKKVRGAATIDEYSLLAWQARVIQQANLLFQQHGTPPFEGDDKWLLDLKALTQASDGPTRAVNLLGENGIALVVEKCLDRSILDGAAMLNSEGNPVIGLTLRYDQLDRFWYVLFHELGHVFLHLSSNRGFDFFDDDDASIDDMLEREADEFALDTLIAPHEWDACVSRVTRTEQAVQMDAARLSVGASIVAGRIRRESRDYSILSQFVGDSGLRSQLNA
ncbi:MAG: helix-turn-helix domain-containing protein [Gammaproteobacteria bacterium]|nr:helix-turn-helix domain-containing protein [Gammaproteobacteria bacterium]